MKIIEEIILENMIKNNEFICDESGKPYGIKLIEQNIRNKRKLFEANEVLKYDSTK